MTTPDLVPAADVVRRPTCEEVVCVNVRGVWEVRCVNGLRRVARFNEPDTTWSEMQGNACLLRDAINALAAAPKVQEPE